MSQLRETRALHFESRSESDLRILGRRDHRIDEWLISRLQQPITTTTATSPQLSILPRILFIGLVAACFGAMQLSGQVKSSVINGLVTDSAGSVIPGAQLLVTEQATNTSQNAVSTGSGECSIPYLAVGVYTVEVQKQGFKSFMVSGIALPLGQQFT
jgi:hypothetical protein